MRAFERSPAAGIGVALVWVKRLVFWGFGSAAQAAWLFDPIGGLGEEFTSTKQPRATDRGLSSLAEEGSSVPRAGSGDRGLVAALDLFPVYHVEKRADIFRAAILVFQVIGVLPYV